MRCSTLVETCSIGICFQAMKKVALWSGGICVTVLIWVVVFGGMSWLGGEAPAPIFNPTVNRYIVGPGLILVAVVSVVALAMSLREFLAELFDAPREHCNDRSKHNH